MTIFVKGLPDEFVKDLAERFGGVNPVQGVFLAGSSAHAELLWHRDAEEQLLSDVEVGVVSTSLAIRGEIRRRAASLSEKYQCEVEPFLITPRRLSLGSPKNLSFRPHTPNVLMFDVINGAKWIMGEPGKLTLASFESSELPVWEGARLILNRLGEGSELLIPWFSGQTVSNEAELNRWLIKLLLATGDACLIAEGSYISGYSHRARLWQEFVPAGGVSETFYQYVNNAYLVRLGEDRNFTEMDPAEILTGVLAILKEVLAKHLDQSLSDNLDFDGWMKLFRGHSIPVRYQAPLAILDAQFDTLLTLPNFIRSDFGWRLVCKGALANLPVQLLVYGIIYSGLSHFSREGNWVQLNDLLDIYSYQTSEDISIRTKALWNVFCK